MPDFHHFHSFVGRARGLFLTHVPSQMLYERLLPQNLRAPRTFIFAKSQFSIWRYGCRCASATCHGHVSHVANSGPEVALADLNYT